MQTGAIETALGYRRRLVKLDAQTVPRLRADVVRQLRDWGYERHTDDAALLVNELLANVVRHANGRGVLYMAPLGETLIVVVGDKSGRLPVVQEPDFERESGRGMNLIACVASEWGVERTKSGKYVWCSVGPYAVEARVNSCARCGTSLPIGERKGFAGWVLQEGKPDIRIFYCGQCTNRMVEERTGVTSRQGELVCSAISAS